MKIKTKLTLGVGLLFAMIAMLTLLSTIFINQLAFDSKNILVANYNSLDYCRNMLRALEKYDVEPDALDKFSQHLNSQNKNITEVGEAELSQDLIVHFNAMQKNPADAPLLLKIRSDINGIMKLNLDAILRKSLYAEKSSKNATIWITISGVVCFIVAFTLLINLPGNIANPVQELTTSIKQIANENYTQRVHFQSNSEFGELASSFNSMAEKLEEYNSSNLAKLMFEKKRIETLINKMKDPVYGLDENRIFIFVNEEALKVTGLTANEILGKKANELALTNDLIRSLVKDLSIPSASTNEQLKIYANGKESYFEKEIINIAIVPTGEEAEILIGYVILLQNVTAFKELDFAKTNFLATISHEFKTPISSIKMSLDLLQNKKTGRLTADQDSLLQSISEDANRLLKITGELLKMTQVESGKIQLSILPIDARQIIDYAMEATKKQAEQKQIKFEIDYQEPLSKVNADNEKTAWVLTNLISNAIRYSHENATITLKIIQTTQKILISVKDTGQGISPQYKDKIFDRYFRVPGTKTEGTGLGLSICKEFIEAQGGNISVESELGAGSTFTLSLNKLSV